MSIQDGPRPAPGAHMRGEIGEQPGRWLELAGPGLAAVAEAAQLIRLASPELLVFVARGSSDHAAQYGQYLAHNLLGVPALLATPGTRTVYGKQLRYPRSVAIALSQSGESPDLLATVESVRAAGVPTVAITNSPLSSLAGLADVHVPLLAGPELSVAATKTYTSELVALRLLIGLAAGSPSGAMAEELAAVAERAKGIIAAELSGPGQVGSLRGHLAAMIVGRGYGMATAREGALKLMETCRMHASGWSASDATHGPLGQVRTGMPVIGLTSEPESATGVRAFLAAAGSLGATVIEIANPTQDGSFSPMLDILPLQAAALRTSLAEGLDPDSPAGLSKVTLTN